MKLTDAEVRELFDEMKSTLDKVKSYHKHKRDLYNGDYISRVLSVLENKKIESIIEEKLEWPRIGVDGMLSELNFDAFESDSIGLTKLFISSGGEDADISAKRQSLIGSCAFVAVIPRENDLPILVPFSGSEATGLMEARGKELQFAIAVKSYNNRLPSEYYFFAKGEIYILDTYGKVIDGVELEVPVMPIVAYCFDSDAAVRPFGSSRISKTAESALKSGLNSLALMEQGGITNVLKSDLIIMGGSGSQGIKSTEVNGAIDAYKVIFTDSINGASDVDVKRTNSIDLEGVSNLFVQSARLFAATQGMSPASFGIGEEVDSTVSGKVFTQHKQMARKDYANSTKRLAVKLFQIASGRTDIDFGNYEVVYTEAFEPTRLGLLGDAIIKIQQAGYSIDETFIKKQLGIPTRPSVINNDYPNFDLSKTLNKNYAALREVIDGELYDQVQSSEALEE